MVFLGVLGGSISYDLQMDVPFRDLIWFGVAWSGMVELE